ncbi:MAG: tyrosine-protein phosphatase, partial [Thermodesulfobacteriota bacterium]
MLIDAAAERLDAQSVRICWESAYDVEVAVYAGKTPDRVDLREPVALSDHGCAEVGGLDPLARYYFLLEAGGERLMTAERRVCMEGTVNFRDLGGYETAAGRRVRWGRVFRSDGLSRLSYRDLEQFRQMGIRRVYDLRTRSEMAGAPDRLPGEPDQVLSPTEFIAFTNQAGDPTGLGEDWGLVEEPIDTIDKNGFWLHGVEYTAAELIPYTTGDKKGPRPQLVARYDRAHAARGVLREVKVLRVLDGGQYDPLCIAVNRDRLKHDEAGRAEFLAFRREYLRVLMAKRNLSERAVLAFEEQENEIKSFFDEQDAHERKRLKVARSVSARVMVDVEGEGEESVRAG